MGKMASKSKKQRAKKDNPALLIFAALAVGILALLQNKFGLLSDIRSFYGFHFYDGQNLWPYSEKILLGETRIQHPVEYPALTGLIMWLISFLVSPSETAVVEYYRITASLQIIVFALCAYFIYRLVGKRYAFYFIFAPAVLYSLNRNWDIWAVLTMLCAILLFEKKRYFLSALLLAVSIATKFFPIVLLLPIMIILIRNKQLIEFIKYGLTTLIAWALINLPFVLINFEGWLYFYKFSAERALGSASFYEITNILINSVQFNSIHFYIMNFMVFLIVTIFLIKLKKIPNLSESAFFVMFAFILFNKQYSMQYVIWLTALAVLSFAFIARKSQESLIYIYVLWQAFEFAFQYAYFQRILTDAFANTDKAMTIAVSKDLYAAIGLIRYLVAILFTFLLARSLYKVNLSRFNESHISRA
jgi:uncharacterized membrane protein